MASASTAEGLTALRRLSSGHGCVVHRLAAARGERWRPPHAQKEASTQTSSRSCDRTPGSAAASDVCRGRFTQQCLEMCCGTLRRVQACAGCIRSKPSQYRQSRKQRFDRNAGLRRILHPRTRVGLGMDIARSCGDDSARPLVRMTHTPDYSLAVGGRHTRIGAASGLETASRYWLANQRSLRFSASQTTASSPHPSTLVSRSDPTCFQASPDLRGSLGLPLLPAPLSHLVYALCPGGPSGLHLALVALFNHIRCPRLALVVDAASPAAPYDRAHQRHWQLHAPGHRRVSRGSWVGTSMRSRCLHRS